MLTKFWSENLKGDHAQDLGVNGRTISEWILGKEGPKVSGLAAWSENCEWYSSLPLGAVV